MHNKKITEMSPEQLAVHVDMLVKSQNELTSEMKSLTSQLIIQNERQIQEREELNKERLRIDDLCGRLRKVEDDRLREEQGRNFIHKHWPWIMVTVFALGVFGTQLVRTSITSYQKSQVTPREQQGTRLP